MEKEYKNLVLGCQNCKQDFTIESEDFSFYEKIKVPPPTFCPECRMIRRMMWRNERSLYKRPCDLCGKSFISIYSIDTEFKIFCSSCWKSDKWDPRDYGMDLDFSKPFFKQFRELMLKVPRQGLVHIKEPIINSDYANYLSEAKNAYLSYSVIKVSEDVFYSKNVDNSKYIFDSLSVVQCEKCVENVNGAKNYSSDHLFYSENCIDSKYLYNCKNCSNCMGCVGLRNKQYCIFNVEYSKEKYEDEIKKYNLSSHDSLKEFEEAFHRLEQNFPRHYMNSINSINSTGFGLKDCKNCKHVFESYGGENVKYAFRSPTIKDSMDTLNSGWSELMYEFSSGGGERSQNSKFIINGMESQIDCEYTDSCGFGSNNLLGCIGLKKSNYYILNKQYSKEEYFILINKIKDHMDALPYIDRTGKVYKYGEFFPAEFSPFCYNETIAQEHFPINKSMSLGLGYPWKEFTDRNYNVEIKGNDLETEEMRSGQVIVGKTISCAHLGKCEHQCTEVYKILLQEYNLYKELNIALPICCPNCRHHNRLNYKNPLKLWHRQCMCEKEGHNNHAGQCEVEFETSYAPERPEIVYCEKCYQQEVY